jgi:hypothetical protein
MYKSQKTQIHHLLLEVPQPHDFDYLLLIANLIHVPTKKYKKPRKRTILSTAVAYNSVLKNMGWRVIDAGCSHR